MAKDETLKLEPKADPNPPAPVDDGLIEVSKDGETLRVHPTCVDEHRKNGWQ